MPKYEYEHVFIQHLTNHQQTTGIPIDVADGLNAWGSDGWEIVHMEAVWVWQKADQGACWPEALRGYYVTFRREPGNQSGMSVATAQAEASASASMGDIPL
jgi:hypothetical protein